MIQPTTLLPWLLTSLEIDIASGPKGRMVREKGKAREQTWTPCTACLSLSWWHRRRKSWFLKPDEMQSFFLIEYTKVGLPYLNMCTPQVSHCWSCPLLCRNIFAWCSPICLICFSGLSFRESYEKKKNHCQCQGASPLCFLPRVLQFQVLHLSLYLSWFLHMIHYR